MFGIMLNVSKSSKDSVILPPKLGPGPTKLKGGGKGAGFFGETPTSQFITGDQLAAAVSMTIGTGWLPNEPWLKFVIDGTIVYVAKKTYRYNISWDQLNGLNVVRGNKTISIRGETYKVRLLRGANVLNLSGSIVADGPQTHGSEWNRLLYHIMRNMFSGKMTSEGISTGDWASYTNSELHMQYDVIPGGKWIGSHQFCQEAVGSKVLCRGFADVTGAHAQSSSMMHEQFGWRPVLELVQ